MRRTALLLGALGLGATPLAFALLPQTRPTVAGTPDLLTGATLLAFLALPWAIQLVAAWRGHARFALASGALMALFEAAALITALRHPTGSFAALVYLVKPVGQVLGALPLAALGLWIGSHVQAIAKPGPRSPQ